MPNCVQSTKHSLFANAQCERVFSSKTTSKTARVALLVIGVAAIGGGSALWFASIPSQTFVIACLYSAGTLKIGCFTYLNISSKKLFRPPLNPMPIELTVNLHVTHNISGERASTKLAEIQHDRFFETDEPENEWESADETILTQKETVWERSESEEAYFDAMSEVSDYDTCSLVASESSLQDQPVRLKPIQDLVDLVGETVWRSACRDYSEKEIASFWEDKDWGFLYLAPLFVRLYQTLGSERIEILPLLIDQCGSSRRSDTTSSKKDLKNASTIPFDTEKLREIGLKALLPLSPLIADDFPARQFFCDLFHQLSFESTPYFQKLGYSEEEGRRAVEETFVEVTLPFLSQLKLNPELDVLEYLVDIESRKNGEKTASFETERVTPKVEHLFTVKEPMDNMAAEFLTTLDPLFQNDFLPLLKTHDEKGRTTALAQDIAEITKNTFSQVKAVFGGHVNSMGDYIQKSYLLSEVVSQIMLDKKENGSLATDLLNLFITPLDEAKIDSAPLKELINEGLSLFAQEENLFTKELWHTLERIPFHDSLLVLLVGLVCAKDLHKFRPWLSKHTNAFIALGELFQIEEARDHKTSLKALLKISLALLAPVNGVLLGKWPGKSKLIRKTIKTLMKKLASTLIDDPKKGQTEVTKETLEQRKHNKKRLQACIPMLEFILLGIFGSSKREKGALENFQNKILTFYQNLYTFDVETYAQDPAKLREHVEAQLTTLGFTQKESAV